MLISVSFLVAADCADAKPAADVPVAGLDNADSSDSVHQQSEVGQEIPDTAMFSSVGLW